MNRLWSVVVDNARAVLAGMACLALVACGGGGGGPSTSLRGNINAGVARADGPAVPGTNVLRVQVDAGESGRLINAPMVSVRVCVPGTDQCVTVDRVLVDTGSSGLRIVASALNGLLLPAVTRSLQPVAQCQSFASGRTWGAVRKADVFLASEKASAISVQVINDTAIPKPLGLCTDDIGASLGTNGILGVGFLTADCPACANTSTFQVYYRCNGACTTTDLPAAEQVSNPVAALPTNNNGVVLSLPAVPTGGAGVVTGSLILGVGTQSNNQLGSASIYRAESSAACLGEVFTTTYKGVAYPCSFIDSGSNGYFFDEPTLSSCGPNNDFYCQFEDPLALSAVNTARFPPLNTGRIDFFIDSVTNLRADAGAAHIGGSTSIDDSFDWGLPFFYGRTVFTVRSGASSPAGAGPYWAY